MSPDEKAALEWLDAVERTNGYCPSVNVSRIATTLKAMLAQPRLPEELDQHTAEQMAAAFYIHNGSDAGSMRAAIGWLRNSLTKPATKEVEVWRVEYAAGQTPCVLGCYTREEADEQARRMQSNYSCIRVTGPHTQTVPA